MRLTKKPFWPAAVVNMATGGQVQVIKVKKHFFNTVSLATNPSKRCAATHTRRREGINTYPATKNHLATAARAMTRGRHLPACGNKLPCRRYHRSYK